jgi:predicted acyl esterase
MRRLLPLLVVAAALAAPGGAAAAAPAPFGLPCTLTGGFRFCPATTLPQRVPSFDGVPLDADVSLPPTGDGPFPLVIMLHGVGSTKTMFESTTAAGSGPIFWHANNAYYAQRGYAVLTYSQRGWGNSCGTAASRADTPACDRGWITLADQRYDTRDLQTLAGRLVDEGVVDPRAIGVTGISLGGGGTAGAAFMNGDTRLPDGSFVPWRSPKGTKLSIAAAWPRWQWSDLADSLVPNGRFRDDDLRTIGLGSTPPGLLKQSFVTGLYATSLTKAYVSPPGVDPSADLVTWYGLLNAGEPYGKGVQDVEDDLREYHSAVGLYDRTPAPLLLQDGFTDDLFPAPQALRTYLAVRGDRATSVALQLGDLGHGRAQNKARVNQAFNQQGSDFFDAYLRRQGTPPKRGSVTAFPQTCPASAPDGNPITAPSWSAIAPRTFVLAGAAPRHRTPAFAGAVARTQTLTSTGGTAATATALNFPENAGQTCKRFPASRAPGTAVYRRTVTSAVTMVGFPEVTANVRVTGRYPQIDARLWDVAPNGTQTIVARGAYRLTRTSGRVTFQLWGNAYRFPPGHTVSLELLGRDASGPKALDPPPETAAQVLADAGKLAPLLGNFMRPSNGRFSVRLSGVRATLPTR